MSNSSELSSKYWLEDSSFVAEELHDFITEFGSFNPDWFVEINFHLLRDVGLVEESRLQFCNLSQHEQACVSCDFLYKEKECLLWYDLFKMIRWSVLRRAPPCIRIAYVRKQIRVVVDFLVRVHLLEPPFYKSKGTPNCSWLQEWGLCQSDRYCQSMITRNPLSYSTSRGRIKQHQPLQIE
ncbi:MAG: hypothetical protein GF411_17220 [Candidatus Lokiarchaeota archaeon]|nr:hypothetical protein [Candidatus Lokiarchaeota archaeon]